MNSLTSNATTSPSVAQFITDQLGRLDRTQREVSEAAGFEKPNIVTMIKQGKTRVPLAKIGPLARALEVDPIWFFELVMNEYQPDTWDEIRSIISTPILSEHEIHVVNAMRAAGVSATKVLPSQIPSLVRAIKGAILRPASVVNSQLIAM